jgi:hypothetical protein
MPMNNNKGIAIALGAVAAVFGVSLLARFVMLSQYGFAGSWMYVGLPIGGISVVVLLLRLGLLNFGQRSSGTIQPLRFDDYNSPAYTPPPGFPQPVGSVPQRLQELDTVRASGAISDAEYAAKRQQIISSM